MSDLVSVPASYSGSMLLEQAFNSAGSTIMDVAAGASEHSPHLNRRARD